MKIKDVAFVAYPSDDVAGTRAWYENTLGLAFAGAYVEEMCALQASPFAAVWIAARMRSQQPQRRPCFCFSEALPTSQDGQVR